MKEMQTEAMQYISVSVHRRLMRGSRVARRLCYQKTHLMSLNKSNPAVSWVICQKSMGEATLVVPSLDAVSSGAAWILVAFLRS
jgi:hypothetical protein